MVINTIGATWEGNQVWFILGGGAIFGSSTFQVDWNSSPRGAAMR
jgi:hypothetical protein